MLSFIRLEFIFEWPKEKPALNSKKECDFGSDQTCLHSRSVLRADVDENGGELGQP